MKVILVSLVCCLVFCEIGANSNKQHAKSKHHIPHEKAKAIEALTGKRVETLNNMADVLIREAPELMTKYKFDPFHAPDQKQFVAPVNLDLTNLVIHNLTTIKRFSDIILLDNEENGQLYLALKLKFSNVLVKSLYNAYIKLAILPSVGSKGNLIAKVPEIDIDLKVTVDFRDVNVTLNSLVLSMDKKLLDVKLSGSLEGQLANIAMPVIVSIMQGVVLNVLEGPLKKEINTILHSVTSMMNDYLLGMS